MTRHEFLPLSGYAEHDPEDMLRRAADIARKPLDQFVTHVDE